MKRGRLKYRFLKNLSEFNIIRSNRKQKNEFMCFSIKKTETNYYSNLMNKMSQTVLAYFKTSVIVTLVDNDDIITDNEKTLKF